MPGGECKSREYVGSVMVLGRSGGLYIRGLSTNTTPPRHHQHRHHHNCSHDYFQLWAISCDRTRTLTVPSSMGEIGAAKMIGLKNAEKMAKNQLTASGPTTQTDRGWDALLSIYSTAQHSKIQRKNVGSTFQQSILSQIKLPL